MNKKIFRELFIENLIVDPQGHMLKISKNDKTRLDLGKDKIWLLYLPLKENEEAESVFYRLEELLNVP